MANDRFGVSLADGLIVEAVAYGGAPTLCLSTQAGCALGCAFCASGRRGLKRNLTRSELDFQLAAARNRGIAPLRLTLSGIGEPLHNPGPVRDFLLAQRAAGLPVSLTTTGGPLPRLREFLHLPHNGLMLSLHAATPATRGRLLPRAPALDELFSLLAVEWGRLSRRQRRRIGFNYLLLGGINDGEAEIAALTACLRPFPEATLHLLACNPVEDSPFASPLPGRIDELQRQLAGCGLNVRQANRWRRRAEGGCGTLALREEAAVS
ncbi:MAG: radical SAM protein [Desulfobacteraceae bacterium]|nr:radical SAM protein [Desulfobacteraceae bacterium]